MPRTLALTFTILLTMSVLIGYSSGSSEPYVTKAGRIIALNEFGIATISDSLTIFNNSTSPMGSMAWGIPKAYSNRLELIEANGPLGDSVKIETTPSESLIIQWYMVSFTQPISAGSTSEVTIKASFSNLIKAEGDEYRFIFTAYPTLAIKSEFCNSTIMLPIGATPKQWPNETFTPIELEGKPALIGFEKPVEPLTIKEISFKYSSDAQELISFKSISREITIAPTGQVTSKDTYQITNFGGELNSLTISRPKNNSPIMLYDSVGPLPERLQVQKDSITVQTRFGKIKKNSSFTFSLQYDLPSQDLLKRLEWKGLYSFTTELASTSGYIAESYITNVSIPKGAKLEKSLITPTSLASLQDGEIISYNLGRLPPIVTKTTTIDYQYNILSSSIYIFQWILIIELIIGAIAAAVLLRRPTIARVTAPLEKIKRFIDLQDEKRAIRLELEKIAGEATRGAITKHDYRRRSRTIETRLSELNRYLATLKSELKTIDPRYDQITRRLEKAESEIDALRASENQITNQYRSGRISKDVYESLGKDLRKRIDKAKETIDSIIVTLREETR